MRTLIKVLLLIPLIWVAGFLWFMLSLPKPAPDAVETDGIVVLTGGPGRLARGVEILRQRRAERLLVSGVDPVVQPADLAAELNVDEALFGCCIDLGKWADDTQSNGAEVAHWAEERSYKTLRVVTAADHMPRALAEIETRLPPHIDIVADAVPASSGMVSLAREYSKYLARRAQRFFAA